jgi:hypothetical protein
VRKPAWVLIALALISAGLYVLVAAMSGTVGFPLDDAWIHQVYARNLALRGEFAFTPGQPSAGSTSPLWTIALAAGYLLHIDFRFWSYLLGALFLGGSALLAMRLAARVFPDSYLSPLLLPLFVLFEWHMAWSAVSGMEITLFIFLSLLLLVQFASGSPKWLMGIVGGLLTLTRPEGFVLAALVGAGLVLPESERERDEGRSIPLPDRARTLLLYALGYTVLLIPYIVFNLSVSGSLFPNTFYAKNVEYAKLFQVPFIMRWLDLSRVPWEGAQVLLLPGLVFAVANLAGKKEWRSLVPFGWVLLLPALYALRLPVAYQHGRYEMPIIPLIGLYGIYGTAALLRRVRIRVVRAAWGISVAVLVVVLWLMRANVYADEVAIIDCEMVQTAQWVAANASPDASVAAHDIGALGYFYDKQIIDLAGLVSPEVIPFMRDEGRLRDFLVSRKATLAIFFPDWYPTLASDTQLVPVYRRNCPVARGASETDMVVYEITLTAR